MIHFDLSELFLISRGKHPFYGIARVVAELAFETARLRPDTVFVVHDQSRRRFLRVEPRLDGTSGNLVSLDLAPSEVPLALAAARPDDPLLKRGATAVANAAVRLLNRGRRPFEPIDLAGATLVSAARPKLMAQMLEDLPGGGPSAARFVPLLHDAIPLHGAKGGKLGVNARGFRADTAAAIARADLVLANSLYTAQDIARFAGEGLLPAPGRCHVVPLAHECRETGEADGAPDIGRPYLLGVGMTPGRKNMELVLRAQERMLAAGRRPPLLVVTGSFKPRMVRKLSSGGFPSFTEHVMLAGNLSQARLVALYRGALATVMASRLEGWGLPLGESLWLGTPALSSRHSSLPEVGGDLALYFDADDPAELAAHVSRLSDDAAFVADLRRRISGRPGLRSWRRVATEIVEAVEGNSG